MRRKTERGGGGGSINVLNKQTCFNHELVRRESDRDQNSMLVITKSFGFVPHRRYIGYRIEKVGHGCRGGVFESCGLGRSNGGHSM